MIREGSHVCYIFLIFALKHRLSVLAGTTLVRGFLLVPTIYLLSNRN